MKKILLISTVFLILTVAHGQQSKIDSLQNLLKNAKADTNKANILNTIASALRNTGDYEKALNYSKQAIIIANSSLRGAGQSFNDNERALLIHAMMKEKAIALNIIGVVCDDQGNYPEALKNYFAAMKIREAIGDKKGIGTSYNNIGNIYYGQGNYAEALKNHFSSLKIKKELGDKYGIATSYNNIGISYKEQNNYAEALKNHFASLKIREELGDKQGIATSFNNIGIIYYEQGKISDDLSERKQLLNDALKNYLACMKIGEQLGDKNIIASSYINLGSVYTLLHNFSEARKYLNDGLSLSKEIEFRDAIKESYGCLAELDSMEAKGMEAFLHYKMYTVYKDSLINEENIKETERAKNQYEFDKKETVLKEQQEKERVVNEEKSRKQKIITWSVALGLFLVIVFAGFIFRSLRITRKQKQIIEVQKTEVEKSKHIIEEKNKDITDSINYAKRIQQAKLPSKELIYTSLPDCFVLFKPKDIVSGDFYYFHKTDKSIFIASADCTGHGVPGALMSMIGSEQLNDALAHSEDTSEILKHINKGIKVSLRQTDSHESTRDGMDIALCSIDTNARIVTYAGANRPIWIIRNGQTVVEEIKATKKAIGGFTEDSQHFDTHIIQLQQDDTFYIATDGYADTFGKQDKKLTTKKFKEILLSIQDKSLKEQGQHLDNFIENWKGGTEQVDDILVIGVRL